MLKIMVNGASSRAVESDVLTAGRVGLKCGFAFDSAWDDLQKIAVFSAGLVTRDAVITDGAATVPAEVLAKPGVPLRVGVCGRLSDGTVVIPTVWVNFGRIMEGALNSGNNAESPSPDLVAQILAAANSAVETATAIAAELAALKEALKAGTEETAEYHLGYYLDDNGDPQRVEENESEQEG